MNDTAKNFFILAINLNILYNYFDASKLFLDLYLAKFLKYFNKIVHSV